MNDERSATCVLASSVVALIVNPACSLAILHCESTGVGEG